MKTDDILNKIQQTRARNNENWIAILRLSFQHAPDASKQIMKKIAKCDRKINELTKELTE